MKLLFSLVFIFSLLQIGCLNINFIDIGDSKNKLYGILEPTDRFVLINPGTQRPVYSYIENNIHYLISFDKNNLIDYIILESDKYYIPENIKKGDTVNNCLEKRGILMVEQGVCFFVLMQSGWLGYIDHINNNIDNIKDAKIKFFYKKNMKDNYFFIEYEKYLFLEVI